MHRESYTWKENKEGMSAEVEVKPRKYEVMSANNGSRERISSRVWSTVTKDFKELKHKQRENLGNWNLDYIL